MTRKRALLAFPDDAGEPQARLILSREPDLDSQYRTAAWLMCNPSRADHLVDDPTAGRVQHHSARNDCPRTLVGNVWPLRTPYPADLWAALPLPEIMLQANLEALAMIAGQADLHVVAYGAEPGRRHPRAVAAALDAFTLGGRFELYCLGTTDDGHPLHPLARGKFAVRNDTDLRPWNRS